IPYLKRVMRLDPHHAPDLYSFIGNAYFFTGQFESSLEMHRVAGNRLANLPQVHVWHAAVAAQLDRMEEAKAAAANVLRLQPDFTVSSFLSLIRLADGKDEQRLSAALRKAG